MKKIKKSTGNILIEMLNRAKRYNAKEIVRIEKMGRTPLMTVDYNNHFYNEIIEEVKQVTRKY